MIICVINDDVKIWIFSVRARSFIYLNDPDVLNGSYVNDSSLVAITPYQIILIGVRYLATTLNDPVTFCSVIKGLINENK